MTWIQAWLKSSPENTLAGLIKPNDLTELQTCQVVWLVSFFMTALYKPER